MARLVELLATALVLLVALLLTLQQVGACRL
jgi:hypothetical protein